MKKKVAGFLAGICLLGLLAGCGGGGARTATAAGESMAAAEFGIADGGTMDSASGDSAMSQESSAIPAGNERLANAKLIYTASMEAETTNFDGCAADLDKLVEQLGGYFERTSVNSYDSGYRYASYTVRVPAEQFQAFCNQVGELCHVVYQDSGVENISEAYYDTESRLNTQRTKLERLQALLAQADKMEDIITIESAISETELAIEQLSGALRGYDALVDFSTVYVNLQEVYRLRNTEEPASGFASRLGTAFSSGWKNFVSGAENFAVALAYGWVGALVLIAAVAVGIVVWRKKRHGLKEKLRGVMPEKKDDNPK